MREFRISMAIGIAALLAATPLSAKTLVYCSEGSPENFYPAINTTGTSFDASTDVYNRIVEFERGGTTVQPGLAERWDISEDGKVYTFHLRKGVKWQSNRLFKPTRDFNADDFIFSIERQWKENHPYYRVTSSDHSYFSDMGMPSLLKSVDKLDDSTVRITLNQPEAPFLADLAMEYAGIQSKEYADAMLKAGTPEKIDQEPIGTGPFSLVQYQKDSLIRYRAFPDYWGGKAKIDDLIFAITPDAAVRWAKLQKNECQVMPYPNPADLDAMRKDPNVRVLEQPGLNVGYLAYQTTKKPFDDARVRRAFNMAINKKAIIDAVYLSTGIAAKNPIPPTMWSYNDDIKDDPYDPAAAKKLLAEAGYPDGFSTDLWAMPVQRPYNPNARRIAELMQADLAKIGVKAEIKSFEWGEYRKRAQNGEHMMAQLGWTGDNGDPDNFLHTLLGCDAALGSSSGNNIAKWCYKPFDDLVMKAKTVSAQGERTALYRQAQVVFKEQAPWFTIAHAVQIAPVRKQVVDFKLSPFGRHSFYGVDITP
jgi:dipeptide transport system substrate-binding protein